MNFVTDWLQAATADSALIQTQIGSTGKTQTKHVQAWAEAFRLFRLAHSL